MIVGLEGTRVNEKGERSERTRMPARGSSHTSNTSPSHSRESNCTDNASRACRREQAALDNPLEVPAMLSFLTYRHWEAEVRGLEAFPEDQWPDKIELLYYSYHI
jgi:cytochrome bd-type quinol oxidase subunit 1